jgi:hypothetical protein
MTSKIAFRVVVALSVVGAGMLPEPASAFTAVQDQPAAGQTVARRIGTIKAINGNSITLTPDSGPEVAVTVQPNARLLRLAPGQTDVKAASPIQLQDLKVGDKIRVRGYAAGDATTFPALEVLVLTSSAVAAVGEQIRQDWLKRGTGGPVTAVDPAAGTVTLSVSSLGGKKTITVLTTKNTVVRRYAPDSAKFEDAKPSTLQAIHVGDQLRARGDRSPDGSQVTAEEIVAGNFPNIAGLIKSVDASSGTISVQDLVSKKTVDLKINADSQLHKIPDEMARGFAARLKAAGGSSGAGANSSSGSSAAGAHASTAGASPSGMGQGSAAGGGGTPPGAAQGSGAMGPGGAGGARSGGGFDLQRLLDQTPAVALADLHKGDAVAILATEGTPSGGSSVIKLFSGVEPILQANGSQAMMLAPWSLGGAPGGDAGSQ